MAQQGGCGQEGKRNSVGLVSRPNQGSRFSSRCTYMLETDDPWAASRIAIEAVNAQHRRRREEIREAIKVADVPMPPALVHDLTQLSHHEALDVLRDHPGYVL